MRQLLRIFCLFLLSPAAFGQGIWYTENNGLGKGFSFSLHDGNYRFKLGGFLQPAMQLNQTGNEKPGYLLNSRRSYLYLKGNTLNNRLSFFAQANFSDPTPLLDAWVGYDILGFWTLSIGQRRTFTNNREMCFDEDRLAISERSLLSTSFSGNGREFGLFLQGRWHMLRPQLAITSGDGPNSFGTNATDTDLGGFKYGGRLDALPMGDFSQGNGDLLADLHHEPKLKMLLGVAGSYNQGVSDAKGEGHGNFQFYNAKKETQLPDYRKLSADILLKYKGFSLMAEWMQSTAGNLKGLYLDSSANLQQVLKPGQISQFLVLGSAWNAELGYVTKSGYGINLRHSELSPEFSAETGSQLKATNASTLGLARYFKGNALRLQLALSRIRYKTGPDQTQADLLMQVVF